MHVYVHVCMCVREGWQEKEKQVICTLFKNTDTVDFLIPDSLCKTEFISQQNGERKKMYRTSRRGTLQDEPDITTSMPQK